MVDHGGLPPRGMIRPYMRISAGAGLITFGIAISIGAARRSPGDGWLATDLAIADLPPTMAAGGWERWISSTQSVVSPSPVVYRNRPGYGGEFQLSTAVRYSQTIDDKRNPAGVHSSVS